MCGVILKVAPGAHAIASAMMAMPVLILYDLLHIILVSVSEAEMTKVLLALVLRWFLLVQLFIQTWEKQLYITDTSSFPKRINFIRINVIILELSV